jgi:hypothetical protein
MSVLKVKWAQTSAITSLCANLWLCATHILYYPDALLTLSSPPSLFYICFCLPTSFWSQVEVRVD